MDQTEEHAALVAAVVRVVDGVAQLYEQRQHRPDRWRAAARARALHELMEGLAGDILHHDEVLVVVTADFVDLADIVVVQLGGNLGLVDEGAQRAFIFVKVRVESLETNLHFAVSNAPRRSVDGRGRSYPQSFMDEKRPEGLSRLARGTAHEQT